MKKKYPVVLQHEEMDCGAACLAMICEFWDCKMPLIKYRELLKFDTNGTSVYDIVGAAKCLKLSATPLKGEFSELVVAISDGQIKLPCIAMIRKEQFFHYVVINEITKETIIYSDPGEGLCKLPFKEFESVYADAVIMFEKSQEFRPVTYKRKSLVILGGLLKRNVKSLLAIFIFSVFITIISIFGNMILEYTITSSVDSGNVCTDENCNEHTEDVHLENEEANAHDLFNIFKGNLEIIVCVGIIIYVIKLLIEFAQSYIVAKITSQSEYEISYSYFDKLVKLPLKNFTDRKTGDFLARFTDIRKMNSFIVMVATTLLLNLVYLFGFGIVLFFLSYKLLLLNLITMIGFILISVVYQKIINKNNHKALQANANVVSSLEESVKGISLIKTYGVGKKRLSELKEYLANYALHLRKLANVSYMQNSTISFLTSIGNLIVVYAGIKLCLGNVISISTLILYYIMSSYFMGAFSDLLCLLPRCSEAVVVFERIEDIIESETEKTDGINVENITSVELENVCFEYSANKRVLEGLSLTIEKGDKIVLLGKNGCGKSTLANLIVGNYLPTSGKIKYNGMENVSSDSIKNGVTYIEQDTFLFHDTIYNNIILGCEEVDIQRVMEVCKATRVDEFVQKMPAGYDTLLCDNGANLSGGQKQKIALARAILRNSEVYVLDEATSNLDIESEKEIYDILRYHFSGKILIIITHNQELAEIGNKTYLLSGGRLVRKEG